jgi:hypothetical protein
MKKLNLLIATIGVASLGLTEMKAQFANVQVIHNCADAAADTVDIYLNGVKALDNFAFRKATPFIPVPAAVQIIIAVAPKTSTSVAQAIFTSLPLILSTNTKYIIVADGIVSSTGYSPSSTVTPFGLKIYSPADTTAPSGSTKLLVHHGSTDAPTVDIVVPALNFATITDNVSYGNFNSVGYVSAPSTANAGVQVRNAAGNTVVAEFTAPLTAIDQKGVTVFASGFLNPANNSNGAAFGLFAALPSGAVVALASTTISSARLQIAHNCADAIVDSVDVYVNGGKLLDNFAFRRATPFIDVPANTPLLVEIAPKTSTSASQNIFNATVNLAPNSKVIAVAQGIVSTSGYSPLKPFGLALNLTAREEGTNAANTDILVLHGSTDAPAVDVDANGTLPNLISNLAYDNFQGYASVPTANYTLNVKPAGASAIVASFSAPLATLAQQGKALAVVASGFLTPASNSNGPAFGLFVILPSGGNFLPLSLITSLNDINQAIEFAVFPNPISSNNTLNIASKVNEVINYTITDVTGKTMAAARINLQVGNNPIKLNTDLNKGLYIIKIKSNLSTYSNKLVVE